MASQLTRFRRRSTRVNYQAKWVVYRSWCHRHGHSVSRPTVAKVADFLLYLRCSLVLSYSSIASYRSMLSGVFRFILPELSSNFVLHDLLCSFRLERPLTFLLGTSWSCSGFSAGLRLNLWLRPLCGPSPRRCSFWFPWPPLGVWVSSRPCLVRSPFLAPMLTSR